MVINGRTDLASEAHRLWQDSEEAGNKLSGIVSSQDRLNGLSVTSVEILDETGAKALGKPIGHYFTLELPARFERGSEEFPKAAHALSQLISRCADMKQIDSVLVAALGNPDITPDALGPMTASNVLVTRHLKQGGLEGFASFLSTALCRTGVLGTTGMESALQVKTLCGELKPDLVIAVDALAGADVSRLCRTVQVCSSGIAPGSGVGNDRERMDRESLGVPVIALGMPTVVDAGLFSDDPELNAMFVTPRNIDSAVRSAGRLIGYAINLALHRGLTVDDIDMLIG